MSCILYNLYVHDLPKSKARKFLYADDKAYAFQAKNFRRISNTLTNDLRPYSEYCRHWRLLPSAAKTVVSCFHLDNGLACASPLDVKLDDQPLRYDPEPKYLGVTLDRSLTFKKHLTNVSAKLSTRNNIIQKLANTSWGADAQCLRISAQGLVYSSGEYCAPAWMNSTHTKKVDTQLNRTMRIVSGTMKSTPLTWLPALCGILPPDIRRKSALLREYRKITNNEDLPVYADIMNPPGKRLKSRRPPLELVR